MGEKKKLTAPNSQQLLTDTSWLSRSPELGDAIGLPVEQLRERHGELVDKKFSVGLNSSEEAEYKHISLALDQAESPFYDPLKKILQKERDRLTEGRVKNEEEF